MARPDDICIFCKQSTADSRSVEHIVPQSLGNTKNILPAGVVCDNCNNYFGLKVEKPLLESPSVLNVRTFRELCNKRGRIPPIVGFVGRSPREPEPIGPVLFIPSPMRRSGNSLPGRLSVCEKVAQRIVDGELRYLSFPTGELPSQAALLSRLLAKMALEAFIQRVMHIPTSQRRIAEDHQFDGIRDHARRGVPKMWPYHVRPIYDADRPEPRYLNPCGQVIYEYDFLWTPIGELYFVWAFFGVEYTISLGEPSVQGYLEWLETTGGASPLYTEANRMPMPGIVYN